MYRGGEIVKQGMIPERPRAVERRMAATLQSEILRATRGKRRLPGRGEAVRHGDLESRGWM